MLHDGHDLNGIVAQSLDPGQDLILKLGICTDLRLFLGHTNMAFVDIEGLFRLKVFVRPNKGSFRFMDHRIPLDGCLVLQNILGIQRDTLHLHAIANRDRANTLTIAQRIHTGNIQFKYAAILFFHRIGIAIPIAEITGQVHSFRPGRPLTIDPAVVRLMEAVVQMAVGKLCQSSAVAYQLCLFAVIVIHS